MPMKRSLPRTSASQVSRGVFGRAVQSSIRTLWRPSSLPDVRVSAIEELGEGEWREGGALPEQDGQGVAAELAQPTGREVPLVPRPDPLGVVALGELAQHGLDPAPRLHPTRRPSP